MTVLNQLWCEFYNRNCAPWNKTDISQNKCNKKVIIKISSVHFQVCSDAVWCLSINFVIRVRNKQGQEHITPDPPSTLLGLWHSVVSLWAIFWITFSAKIGTLRNHDGDPMDSHFYKLFRDYSNTFNLWNVAELSRSWIRGDGVQVQIEKEKFTVVCSRSPYYCEFGHLTLLFCKGQQRNVQKCKNTRAEQCCTTN